MKKQLILAGLLVVGFASAQTEEDKKYQGNVGINTMKPQTTLDIAANTADGDKVEGLMVPRITYAKMQAMKANLTEDHDGLMVFVTDYVDMNTGQSKDGIYAPYYHYSPYFVYNKHMQEFFPFSPSGLTGVMSKNGTSNSYVLATNAINFKMWSQTPPQLGEGAIDLYTNLAVDIFKPRAIGNYSFAAQGGTASGVSSTAIGDSAQASGDYAAAMGWSAEASGTSAIAMGAEAKAIGNHSFATQGGTASGQSATAMGYTSVAEGEFSTAIGGYLHSYAKGESAIALGGTAEGAYSVTIGAESNTKSYFSLAGTGGVTTNYREVAFGKNFNTDTDVEVETTRLSPTRQIFSVGRNTGSGNRQNALIILRNAHTGIGLPTDTTTPANSKPTEMLDVNGNIRVRGTAGITAGGACTNLGTITFSGDNFYGCKSTGWVRLNN